MCTSTLPYPTLPYNHSPLHSTPLLRPLDPRARELADVGPPGVARDAGRGPAAHARLAVEDDGGVARRPREPEAVLELGRADVEAVGRRRDRDVEGARDAPRRAQLGGLAHVDQEGWFWRAGRGREGLDLQRISLGR